MDTVIDRNHKIRIISFIFETKYNQELSEKVLSIINSYNTLDYTINNNGIFINLNAIDNSILDMIYYIVSEYEKETTIEEDCTNTVCYSNHICIEYSEDFIGSKDTITYSKIDGYLLNLSTKVLTI